jgi:tagatose-6-phosphate ketose/aldose isomerase
MHESSLGFRHGPKSIVDPRTLVVLLMSNDAHTRRYDLDLLTELRSDGRAAKVVALSSTTLGTSSADDVLVEGMSGCADIELAPVLAVFSQLFALFQSLRLNNRPDNPSASGTVNRVVRGVTIHPWRREAPDVPGR